MPRGYDEATWSNKQPSHVLASLLAMLPGATSSHQASQAAPAAATEKHDGGSIPKAATDGPSFSHTVTVTLQGRDIVGQAEQAASEAAAEQVAALNAVHKCAFIVCGACM